LSLSEISSPHTTAFCLGHPQTLPIMASGLDRLERFFTYKRKASAISLEASAENTAEPSTPTDPLDNMQFPSPSFIRPKNTRMAARDEVRIRQPSSRSSSTHDTTWPRKASGDSGCAMLPMPARLPSLNMEPFGELAPMFQGFSFPKPPSTRSSADSGSLSFPGLSEDRSSWPNSPLSRVETPPAEERELASQSPTAHKSEGLSTIPTPPSSTPESSPGLGPLSDWHVEDDHEFEILNESLCADIQRQLEAPLTINTLPPGHGLDCQNAAEPPSPSRSISSSSLQEPEVSDFYTMSDYSIAGDILDDSDLPSTGDTQVTAAPSAPSLPFRYGPLLFLEPPSSCRTAAVAALEAARIATRYSFDMLYVVNLWPGTMTNRGSFCDDTTSVASSHDMTGRLLTAHGLHNCPSPFQISSDVHAEILQSAGWLEYCDEQADASSFGRAYACAFYPGHFDNRRASQQTSGTQSTQEETIDRGLVFAGYRKPNADGSTPCATREELAYLRHDVEALVDMLIDIHVANQIRQPYSFEETSPKSN
jgi:hypothetical protein